MRKNGLLVIVLLVLILTLAGCGMEPIKTEKEIAQDLEESKDFLPGFEMDIDDLEITKRKTDEEDKEDLVYVAVEASNDEVVCKVEYKLTYNLYDSGWILDEVEVYGDESRFLPKVKPSEELIQESIGDSVVVEEQLDLENGTYSCWYDSIIEEDLVTFYLHGRTDFSFNPMTTKWEVADSENISERSEWDIEGSWYGYREECDNHFSPSAQWETVEYRLDISALAEDSFHAKVYREGEFVMETDVYLDNPHGMELQKVDWETIVVDKYDYIFINVTRDYIDFTVGSNFSREPLENQIPEGSVLNIYTYNTELPEIMEAYYPHYTAIDWNTGMLGGVTVKWNITPNADGAYYNNLDETLAKQESVTSDDKIDMFLVDADYVLEYVNSQYTMSMQELGIKKSDISKQYSYTHDMATDSTGELKALTWATYPNALIYNREVAKEIFGTDEPEIIQEYVKDWESFKETAQMVGTEGYKMVATVTDTYRAYASNVSTPWVVNGKINIDTNIEKWVQDSKAMVEDGYAGCCEQWSDEWFDGMYPEGKVFCYLGPAWLINYCMEGTEKGSVGYFNDWGVVEGPQSFPWGDVFLCVASGTDNPDMVTNILMLLTNDYFVMKDVAEYVGGVNNQKVMEDLSQDTTYKGKYLGGQNPYSVYSNNAEKIDLSNMTVYDSVCNQEFQNAMRAYFEGRVTYEEALEVFYEAVTEEYPELSY